MIFWLGVPHNCQLFAHRQTMSVSHVQGYNTHKHPHAPKLILNAVVRQTAGLTSRLTLAMKMPASKTALMCFSQPELSRPSRKSDMEGDRSSHTVTTTQLSHWQEAWSIPDHWTLLNLKLTWMTLNLHAICAQHEEIYITQAYFVFLCWFLMWYLFRQVCQLLCPTLRLKKLQLLHGLPWTFVQAFMAPR